MPLSRIVAPYTTATAPRPNIRTGHLIPVANPLERLIVEERRRLKIIPNAFGERPVLELMFGAMIRAADRGRATKFTDFERRQIAAVRQDLDQDYQTQLGNLAAPPAPSSPARFSSSSRT